MFASISKFSQSLTKQAQDFAKEKAEAEMNYDYQLIQTVGLDTAEELMFAQQEAQMDLSEAATNDAVERAKQAGLNPEQINHIRNSSGARRVNMMNQLLKIRLIITVFISLKMRILLFPSLTRMAQSPTCLCLKLSNKVTWALLSVSLTRWTLNILKVFHRNSLIKLLFISTTARK